MTGKTNPNPDSDSDSDSDLTALPIERRKLMTLVGTASMGTIAGCSTLFDSLRRFGNGQRVPPDEELLYLRADEEHVLSGESDPYRMIRWESGGMLTIEPGGSLVLNEIDNT